MNKLTVQMSYLCIKLLSAMFTQTITVSSNDVSIHLPEEYVGKKVFIEVKSEDEIKTERERKYEELRNHFKAIRINTKDFNFNREAANER
jgi:putative transposon-encoded protein